MQAGRQASYNRQKRLPCTIQTPGEFSSSFLLRVVVLQLRVQYDGGAIDVFFLV